MSETTNAHALSHELAGLAGSTLALSGLVAKLEDALAAATGPVSRETVEVVAERMFRFYCVSLPNGWALIHDAERDWWLKFARAAIAALGRTVEGE